MAGMTGAQPCPYVFRKKVSEIQGTQLRTSVEETSSGSAKKQNLFKSLPIQSHV